MQDIPTADSWLQIILYNWPEEASTALKQVLSWNGKDVKDLPVYFQSTIPDIQTLVESVQTSINLPIIPVDKWTREELPETGVLDKCLVRDRTTWASDIYDVVKAIASSFNLGENNPAKIINAGWDFTADIQTNHEISVWGWGAMVWKNHMHPLYGVFQHPEDPSASCREDLARFATREIVRSIMTGTWSELLDVCRCASQLLHDPYVAKERKSQIRDAILARLDQTACIGSERYLLERLAQDANIDLEITWYDSQLL
jgi:hypothetical protein